MWLTFTCALFYRQMNHKRGQRLEDMEESFDVAAQRLDADELHVQKPTVRRRSTRRLAECNCSQ
jgi:hypothetical protein